MSDLTKQSELKELVKRIEPPEFVSGDTPLIVKAVDLRNAAYVIRNYCDALRSPASAGVREALESIDAILDAVWSTNDRAEEVDGLVKIKAIIRSALSDHGVQNSAAGANTKSDGGVEADTRANETAKALMAHPSPMGSRSCDEKTIACGVAGVAPGPSDPSPGPDVREALEECKHWHERHDKALSKSGRGDADYYWRRDQHRQEIERIDTILSALTRPLGGFVQEETPLRIQELPGSDRQATEAEADSAIKCLRIAIDAAENSNQAGENAAGANALAKALLEKFKITQLTGTATTGASHDRC